MLTTRLPRTFAAFVLSPVALLTLQGTAQGTAHGAVGTRVAAKTWPAPPTVEINTTKDGFCVPGPDPRPAGPVTFRVSTPETGPRWWQVMRLRGSATIAQVKQEYADSASTDPAVALPALRAIYRDVDFHGGTSVVADRPVSVTTELEQGTYYASDTALEGATDDCGTGRTHLQRLHAVGQPPRPSGRVPVNARVDAVVTDAGQRFVAPSTFPSHASIRVRNRAHQPHELIVIGVRPGTTDRDVSAFFGGDTSVPNPFLTVAGGMLAISPGREAVFRIDLPPGQYCLLSFVKNPNTGIKSAIEGMHKTISVR
jgi:hypothetical protein